MRKKSDMTDLLCAHVTAQSDRLYRLAYSYVKNEQDAMDVVQDAVYKLLKNIRSIERTEYIDTWLYRVTINTALDFLRRTKRVTVGLPDWEEGRQDDYSRLYVLDLLDQLDESSRAILILRFFEDRQLQEIADIVGENLSTVKTRLYRALKTLRISMEEEEDWQHERAGL